MSTEVEDLQRRLNETHESRDRLGQTIDLLRSQLEEARKEIEALKSEKLALHNKWVTANNKRPNAELKRKLEVAVKLVKAVFDHCARIMLNASHHPKDVNRDEAVRVNMANEIIELMDKIQKEEK